MNSSEASALPTSGAGKRYQRASAAQAVASATMTDNTLAEKIRRIPRKAASQKSPL
jgi:hypothetical protein